ncbi:hypothetical protein NY2A_B631L [Paramecium bursaria Chlorella virus NY2A]|uniref:Uncharacterized protein B631L n=1 Tax=Paramecium bursaria Chlorella virus NY2A TaxID=46021 RepID=A7IXF6_PBCVN|nr:hypothetical protein NY2A_B631L [Paramecium bursaria Chlorella virus NY2A]ABT15030.1 hypothetical protein NY2A_B631L [Paramecium bursaria Chlorella virus NY2A]
MMFDEPYLCVYASQGAACIGENKHKKICDAVETFWERANSESYKNALRRNNILTNDEIIERLEKNHPKIAELIRIAEENEESSTDVANKYNRLIHEFTKYANENYISTEYCRVIDDALRKTTYTTYGNAQEMKVFQYIRDTLGIDCVEDSTFYKMQAGTIDNEFGSFPWYIGGKIDAINRDRTILIEIKNRVNRLFKHLPSYEMIQIQTYMQLLNLDKAILVECMKTKENNVLHSDVNVVSVNKDDVLWEMEILPKLEGFVDFITRIVYDEKLQDKFLMSKRRSSIVSFHITSYVRKKREEKQNKLLQSNKK